MCSWNPSSGAGPTLARFFLLCTAQTQLASLEACTCVTDRPGCAQAAEKSPVATTSGAGQETKTGLEGKALTPHPIKSDVWQHIPNSLPFSLSVRESIGWPDPDSLLVLLLEPGSHRRFCSDPARGEATGSGCLLISPLRCWHNLLV